MKRAPFVLLGTAAGVGGVLAFHTHQPTSSIAITPPASATPATSPGSSATTPSTAPEGGGVTGSGSTSPTTSPAAAGHGPRRATSQVEPYRYGQMSVTVTEVGSRITDVQMASLSETDPRSVMIDDASIPQLRAEVLSANGANIDGVSGATFTSEAYAAAVQSALDQLGSS